jgi:hypothetical protein
MNCHLNPEREQKHSDDLNRQTAERRRACTQMIPMVLAAFALPLFRISGLDLDATITALDSWIPSRVCLRFKCSFDMCVLLNGEVGKHLRQWPTESSRLPGLGGMNLQGSLDCRALMPR